MDRKIARALVAVQCYGRSGGRHVVPSDSRQVTGSFRPAKQPVHRGRDRHSSDFFFCGCSLKDFCSTRYLRRRHHATSPADLEATGTRRNFSRSGTAL
ncbi:hypothetical protein PF005_g13836 [Phytophthora fragariae]|uniref:Uncharacterized protein n=1 Tax=Phytophthora fragariae TaxID=53985 RepID=A0A6A3ZGD5_9STRA|nr:hypothetical protein PF003_g39565 [Phytophthora fragariae]KAE8934841.1 hypothetical protein PF009_g15187 [Phytophthora fragariae]KAE9003453.1 hypothetical protein PF011_g12890 [Phytophthora fragariae]KAE9089258.1 hypothetical protein PF010_g19064 [Phytophthora fragariae]KAE9104107.1 hypothetical protein PF007_g14165 [Phytophthora fragariae]